MAFGGLAYEAWPRRQDQTRRVILLKPGTYMNNSGQAVRELASFFKADPSQLLVVLDDLALEPGQLRMRPEGSAGGQKGLADVLARLGTMQVPRLRIGIGAAPGRMDPADYVLGQVTQAQFEVLGPALTRAAEAVEDWLFEPIQAAMEKYNRKLEDPAD